MPRPDAQSFFRYLLPTTAARAWGIAVTGGGRFSARAGEVYPPRQHPEDHAFEWEGGRVLGALQVVLITAGTGEFESQATGRVLIGAGTAVLLLPGVWHRYRPSPATGWVEKWVELGGTVIDGLIAAGTFQSRRAVVSTLGADGCERTMDAMHEMLIDSPEGNEGEMAAEAVRLLSRLQDAPGERSRSGGTPIERAVAQAKRRLETESVESPSMPELARELGVGYSHFRREFTRRTGFSPRQYQLRMRLQRAQRLLGATEQSIKEIADRLGFSSAFHLSAAFKSHFGIAPRDWRLRRHQP